MLNCIAVAFYTQWSAWGTCDSSCGDGLQKRTRNCTDVMGADRGQDCGVDVEEQKACVGLPKCVGKLFSVVFNAIRHHNLICEK